MDGENNGKPYEKMDDLGGNPTILGNIQLYKKTPQGLAVWDLKWTFWGKKKSAPNRPVYGKGGMKP